MSKLDDIPMSERPHFVYRIFDADDRLIYIGCARDVTSRLTLHTARSSQSPRSWEIRRRMARHTVEEFPDLATARAAEAAAIRAEQPELNVLHKARADEIERATP